MATQITHIVLADKLYPRFFAGFSRPAFFIGTVFPDIRYQAGLPRDTTHVLDLDLADVQAAPSAFEAGRLLHCLIDVVREAFVTKEGAYDLAPEGARDWTSIIKFIEDDVLYGRVEDWPEIIGYFDRVLLEELSFGATEEQVRAWHENLQAYFAAPPSRESRLAHTALLGVAAERLNSAMELAETAMKDQRVRRIAEALYDQIDTLIANGR